MPFRAVPLQGHVARRVDVGSAAVGGVVVVARRAGAGRVEGEGGQIGGGGTVPRRARGGAPAPGAAKAGCRGGGIAAVALLVRTPRRRRGGQVLRIGRLVVRVGGAGGGGRAVAVIGRGGRRGARRRHVLVRVGDDGGGGAGGGSGTVVRDVLLIPCTSRGRGWAAHPAGRARGGRASGGGPARRRRPSSGDRLGGRRRLGSATARSRPSYARSGPRAGGGYRGLVRARLVAFGGWRRAHLRKSCRRLPFLQSAAARVCPTYFLAGESVQRRRVTLRAGVYECGGSDLRDCGPWAGPVAERVRVEKAVVFGR